MSSILEHQDACLPITAINAVELDGSKFVLSGAGPDVLLTDESSGFLLSRLRVFKRNAVHGFHPLFSGTRNGALYAKLLVWGGQSFRIVKLSVQKSLLKDNIWLSSASAECRCPDWIMDVDSCECPRNDASQVARRRVSLITAHNTLLCAELEDEPSEAAPIRLHEISSKLKAMLYSADVSWISNSQILVAAGTVFGEIAVWSCRFDTGPGAISSSTPSICIHHFFTGHEGSIFGVNTSPEVLIPSESSPRRFLASCSDDRTIRIWDISSCSSPGSESKSLPMDQNVRGTGFGKYIGELDLNEDLCVAKAFGHEARIWGVNFLDASLSNGQLSFNLVSRGEDVTCQLWNFNFRPGLTQENEQTNAKLSHLWTYNHHTGKHIWSLAIRNNPGSFSIYSGGADGSVKSFNVGHGGRHGYLERKQIYTGEEVVASLPDAPSLPAPGNAHKGTKKRSGEKISKYAFVSDDSFIAMTTVGKVLLGRVSGQDGETFISWKYLTTLDGLTTYCQVAAYPQNGIAFMGDKGGEIWLYDHARSSFHKVAQLERKIAGMFALDITADTSSLCSFVVSFIGLSRVTLLQFQISESPSLLNSREFLLPTHFTVTSALLMQDELQMLLGSREGTVALFSTEGTQETPTEPLWCAHEVHGQDAVTSITGLAKTKPSSDPTEASPTEDYILTTGRDGNYCVHMLCSLKDGCQSHGLRTVHRSSPPLGANLETATFDEETNDLLITGFRGKCFVVWNETTQTEVMAVECAGAHRTWVCHPSTSGRVFLWTKAATFNAFFRATPSYRALRTGGHGREVKTMDISTPIVPANHTKLPILATGSEDTAIRLFLLDDSEKEEPYGNFECLRTLKKHNTGLQHIQWSKCGRFLFSSSGMESFHVWRIRHIPGFGIGAVPEGEYPKSQPQSDLRIMHFDAVGVEVEVEGDDVDAYLIFMCYSNSTVRLFYYQSDYKECTYTLLSEGRYTANCLTYARFIPCESRPYLITSATDGYIATWDLSEILGHSFTISDGVVKMTSSCGLLAPLATLTWGHQYAVHQSSIKAMTVHSSSEDRTLLITGGDDNALAVSIVTTPSTPTESETEPLFISRCLPDAHASAINDVTVLQGTRQSGQAEYIIASSGNDQRAKIWSVQFSTSKQDVNAADIRVSLKADEYTAVADLSSIGVYSPGQLTETTKQRMVLCGVGMDMWDVNL